jgi:hypothetical protein
MYYIQWLLYKSEMAGVNYSHVRFSLIMGGWQIFTVKVLVLHLGLKWHQNYLNIQGINNGTTESKNTAEVQFQSRVCWMLLNITGDLPSTYVHHKHWNVPGDTEIAGPEFYRAFRKTCNSLND